MVDIRRKPTISFANEGRAIHSNREAVVTNPRIINPKSTAMQINRSKGLFYFFVHQVHHSTKYGQDKRKKEDGKS